MNKITSGKIGGARRVAVLCSLLLITWACSKPNEVAHPTPAQNSAMNNLDVIAKAPTKKPDAKRVPSPPLQR